MVHERGAARQGQPAEVHRRLRRGRREGRLRLPQYTLNKIVATKFATKNDAAYKLVKAFTWTNEDQNEVAKYIAQDQMKPAEAAKKWIDAHADKVAAWTKG